MALKRWSGEIYHILKMDGTYYFYNFMKLLIRPLIRMILKYFTLHKWISISD